MYYMLDCVLFFKSSFSFLTFSGFALMSFADCTELHSDSPSTPQSSESTYQNHQQQQQCTLLADYSTTERN